MVTVVRETTTLEEFHLKNLRFIRGVNVSSVFNFINGVFFYEILIWIKSKCLLD